MLDDIFLTTSIVKMFKSGKRIGTASGFFFKGGDEKTFLITNKHVIYGEKLDGDPKIDEIRLSLHSDRNNFSISSDIPIHLFEDGNPIWLEHANKKIDIIAIPVDITKDYLYLCFGKDYLDSQDIKIGFEKIFIIGYPLGWYDNIFNLPISRVGHLSSPFGIPFRGQPFLLADVETHKGMSGSPAIIEIKDPVIIKDGKSSIQLGQTRRILVGVFSGQPIWKIRDAKGEEIDIPHSLSVVWFGNLIKEILRI